MADKILDAPTMIGAEIFPFSSTRMPDGVPLAPYDRPTANPESISMVDLSPEARFASISPVETIKSAGVLAGGSASRARRSSTIRWQKTHPGLQNMIMVGLPA